MLDRELPGRRDVPNTVKGAPLARLARAVPGLALTFLYTRVFDPTCFAGKRVALVGPARSAYTSGKGSYIDGFDVVIRINKAVLAVDTGAFTEHIGSKTDVLFHCFFENDFSGGGVLDLQLYDKHKVQYLVNPRATADGWRATFNFYKKYLKRRTVFTLSRSFYEKLSEPFGKYRPTTGFSAVYTVMESEFDELYLTGFTFFKTPYGKGYRDEMREPEQANKYIREAKLHDPDLEFREFKRLLHVHREKRIRMDEEMTRIVAHSQHDEPRVSDRS